MNAMTISENDPEVKMMKIISQNESSPILEDDDWIDCFEILQDPENTEV
jgi:hypothetical protein